jgi:hypothetical protein
MSSPPWSCKHSLVLQTPAFPANFLQAGARSSIGEDRYGERPERLGGLGARGSEDFGPSRSSVDERDRDRLVPKGRGFGYGRGRGAGEAWFLQAAVFPASCVSCKQL